MIHGTSEILFQIILKEANLLDLTPRYSFYLLSRISKFPPPPSRDVTSRSIPATTNQHSFAAALEHSVSISSNGECHVGPSDVCQRFNKEGCLSQYRMVWQRFGRPPRVQEITSPIVRLTDLTFICDSHNLTRRQKGQGQWGKEVHSSRHVNMVWRWNGRKSRLRLRRQELVRVMVIRCYSLLFSIRHQVYIVARCSKYFKMVLCCPRFIHRCSRLNTER